MLEGVFVSRCWMDSYSSRDFACDAWTLGAKVTPSHVKPIDGGGRSSSRELQGGASAVAAESIHPPRGPEDILFRLANWPGMLGKWMPSSPFSKLPKSI